MNNLLGLGSSLLISFAIKIIFFVKVSDGVNEMPSNIISFADKHADQ
jgi:hypothetical protein